MKQIYKQRETEIETEREKRVIEKQKDRESIMTCLWGGGGKRDDLQLCTTFYAIIWNLENSQDFQD